EFTRLFRPGLSPDAAKEKAALPYQVPLAPTPEIGNAFPIDNLPLAAAQNPAVASGAQGTNEAATGIFRSRPAAEPGWVVQQPNGPSEFTRVIAVPKPPEPAPVAAPPPQTPNTAPPSSPVPTVTPSYLPII